MYCLTTCFHSTRDLLARCTLPAGACLLLATSVAAQTSVITSNSAGGVKIDLPRTRVGEAPMPIDQSTESLRYISLTRVLRLVHLLGAIDEAPQELENLAGLDQITAVCVYPEQGELVLAGPVSTPARKPARAKAGKDMEVPAVPVTRLELLLAALHFAATSEARSFRCSIDPLQPAPSPSHGRSDEARGVPRFAPQQSITLTGIDRRSPLAHVCVHADVRLKQLALGAVPSGIDELPELITMLPLRGEHAAPHVWIEANYAAVAESRDEHAWRLAAPQPSARAQLPTTSQSPTNAKTPRGVEQWAAQLTHSFEPISTRHPVFAELRRMMNFCQAAVLIQDQPTLAAMLEQSAFPQLPPALFRSSRSTPETLPSLVRQQANGRRRMVVWGGIDVDLQQGSDISSASRAFGDAERDLEDATTPSRWELLKERGQPPADESVWWWGAEEVPVPVREPAGGLQASFYGVAVEQHAVYLIDKSLSMQLASMHDGLSRWERARAELAGALRRGAAAPLDVVAFDEHVLSWRELTSAHPVNPARDLPRFFAAVECGGDTDLASALEYVLAKYPECQALYLLSDGELQSRGRRDTARLWRIVAARQAEHPLRMFTFGVAPTPRGEAILRRLAVETGGTYRRVE